MGDMADFFIQSEEMTRYEESDFPFNDDPDNYNRRYRRRKIFIPYSKITREEITKLQSNEATQRCIRKWKGL